MITSDQLKDVLARVDALHRYLDIDITQLLAAQRRETRIIEGCSSGHLRHNFIERHIFSKMSDAAAQMSVLMQRDEGTAL